MMKLDNYLKSHDVTMPFASRNGIFSHLSLTQEALLLIGSYYFDQEKRVVVKESQVQAEQLKKRIEEIDSSIRVLGYYHEESLRVEAIMQSEQMKAMRLETIFNLMNENYDILVTHAHAVVRKISSLETLSSKILMIQEGGEYDPYQLSRDLVMMGYTKDKYVEKPFTYAMRGGILDIYSIQMKNPVRIEFFDTEVESIREFSIDDQRSTTALKEAQIFFASDILLSEDQQEALKESVFSVSMNMHQRHQMEVLVDQALTQDIHPCLSGFLDLNQGILDFIGSAHIYYSPIEGVNRASKQLVEDSFQYIEEMISNDEMIPVPSMYLDNLNSGFEIFEYDHQDEISIPWHEANLISQNLSDVLRYIKQESQIKPVKVMLEVDHLDDMIKRFIETSIQYQIIDKQDIPTSPGVYLCEGVLNKGYILDNLYVLSEFELNVHARKHFRYDNKYAKAEVISQLSDLNVKDYVVHRQYGIGRYEGIETREIEGRHKDFMKIVYKDNDELYVPLEQFTLVRKFLSSEAAAVRLSKLGSGAWQKNKDRVRASVADIADRLVALYSSRLETSGFAYSKDTAYQKEFEDAFPYPLTLDQDKAIKEIKKDMESAKPMDRLLIGDVGFGKTEVAIRAAFKANADHKQVAFLCPTTILSAQHARTFKDRFKDYPIRIEVLNRFVSPKHQLQILQDAKDGKIDILIGTHRLLSKDVVFKDLGLLIIDEEQRFGVTHKERIKEFKVSVDVLSLSATPIPRTLQMSLIGVRSLSQLNTPPMNRLPVMTYVIERNKETLYDLIRKEMAREGQVYFLHNNTEVIYSIANEISEAIPQARVGIMHGKMDKDAIEDIMLAFIAKEYDVLVCTTIIETGIDIPNANTIIVDNAHRFGLSQLYQIKGRVGRSDRLAYAYFIVPEKKNLTEIAQKRLQAIKEFTQLGSGYKIAMRDLTIRGAGELLGGNQSGFIDTVGMDLYVELLREAVEERQGVIAAEVVDRVQLPIDGYLPSAFTHDDGEKLELYQQINKIENLEMLKQFYNMMIDRYGKLPESVEMLLEKVRLELLLSDPRVESFKERMHHMDITFTYDFSEKLDGLSLFETVSKLSTEIKLKYVSQKITIKIPFYSGWEQDLLALLTQMKEKDDEN